MFNIPERYFKKEFFEAFGNFKDDSFDFSLIEKYFQKKVKTDAFQVLSDKSFNDLDFHELFMFVDRTNSRVGQQYLYNRLRTIPSELCEVAHNEELVEELKNNQELRVSIQRHLLSLSDKDAFHITSLFQDEHLDRPKWFFFIPLLSLLSLILLVLLFFSTVALFAFVGVFIVNIGIHYWNKRNLNQYLSSIPQLLRLNGVARELFKKDLLKRLNPNLKESISIIDKIRNRMSFFRIESGLQSDLGAIVWGFLELLKILFLIEPLLLFGVLKQLDLKRKAIEDVYVFVGLIDTLISVASLRKGLDCWCKPVISSKNKTITGKNVYHPLIPSCVRNSISVNGKSILLTGSNMSGKTSFIRTIGINTITGLALNTCFAEHFEIPRIRLYSAIRISDDLLNDRSYYFEEVLTIKEMIDRSGEGTPNLFLLDEIYKGTNTIERISAGKAVLSYLSKANNIVFVSTHDVELADLLKDEYDLYHFSELVDKNNVDFDYKLKEGKLKNRNAIKILQINNYPESIIKEAIDLSKELDRLIVSNQVN